MCDAKQALRATNHLVEAVFDATLRGATAAWARLPDANAATLATMGAVAGGSAEGVAEASVSAVGGAFFLQALKAATPKAKPSTSTRREGRAGPAASKLVRRSAEGAFDARGARGPGAMTSLFVEILEKGRATRE